MGQSRREVVEELRSSERVARALDEVRPFAEADVEAFRRMLIARFLDAGDGRAPREHLRRPHAAGRTALARLHARAEERAEVVLVIEGLVPALVGTLRPGLSSELDRDWSLVEPELRWGFFFSHEALWLPLAYAEVYEPDDAG